MWVRGLGLNAKQETVPATLSKCLQDQMKILMMSVEQWFLITWQSLGNFAYTETLEEKAVCSEIENW